MKTHRTIIALAGFSLLLIMIMVAIPLWNVMTAFSSITNETEQASLEIQQIEAIAKELASMSTNIHSFITSNEIKFRDACGVSRDAVHRLLDAYEARDLDPGQRRLSGSLHASFGLLERTADRIFALKDPVDRDRVSADTLRLETNRLVALMNRDINTYHTGKGDAQINKLSGYIRLMKTRVALLFFTILLTSATFLFGFAIYILRTVAIPLAKLREGANEIGQGALDHRVTVKGSGDSAHLASQINSTEDKLRGSRTERERALFDRTNALATIEAVALTLNESGNLTDMLAKSLDRIINSLTDLKPGGGVFLCDPDGEVLRLVTRQGLLPEFVQQEQTIRMGECLCGIAARTGEMLFTQDGCSDPRHAHAKGGEDHSHIIIPMKSRGIVLGVMFLYTKKAVALKSTDVQMLDAIGAQLGLAIENFRFYTEVKQSSEKYWDLFENARDILFTMDMSCRLTSANRTAELFTGYSKIELIGKNVKDFLTPEGAGLGAELLSGKEIKTRRLIEFEVVKRDNSRAFAEVSLRRLFKDRIPVGYQVSARDITEQKKMREVLIKAEGLRAIGQMGIAVRHEINNPLTTVIGNVELLIERYEQNDKELTMRLEVILNNALRIAEITKRLREIKKE